VMKISVEKGRQIFGRRINVMLLKKLPCDRRIGPSGNLDRFKIFIDPKSLLEPEPESALTGTAAGQQCSIDIEENKFAIHAQRRSNHVEKLLTTLLVTP